jgi:hypothetical protein
MLATMAPPVSNATTSPAVDQEALPSASYDKINNMVTTTVIVSCLPSGALSFQAAPITIGGPGAGGDQVIWTVKWNIEPDSSLDGKPLDDYVLKIPAALTAMPTGCTLGLQNPQLCEIVVDNSARLSLIKYDILPSAPNGAPLPVHDPTIVVTMDPVGS